MRTKTTVKRQSNITGFSTQKEVEQYKLPKETVLVTAQS